jgi:hypothetical protein
MMRFLGHLFLITVSGVLSWWFFLREPESSAAPPAPATREELTLTLETLAAAATAPEEAPEVPEPSPEPPPPPAAAPTPEPPPEVAKDAPPASEPSPPAPEAGSPDGEADVGPDADSDAESAVESASESTSEEDVDPSAELASELASIAASEELMEQAAKEVRGESRRGFRTTFLCAARDQLDIARWFGEPVVLVAKAGLRPGHERYYRLGADGSIAEVREPAPLTEFRQYRDLFAFAYESLPTPLKELRRRVFARSEVYVFAALIPPREWALVIARRDAALAASNRGRSSPREYDDVRGFTMRYVRLPGGAFDIRVAEIQFADGDVWRVET